MQLCTRFTILLCGCVLNSIAFAQLDSSEQKLATYIVKHNQEAISLLKEVVNINSGTMNFAGVKHVGDVFAEKLGRLTELTRACCIL